MSANGKAGALAACALAALFAAADGVSAQGTAQNPHVREACIDCHGTTGKSLGPDRATIWSSREEPHAVLTGTCRPCHKELPDEFWIVVIPKREGESRPALPPPPQAPLAAPRGEEAAAFAGGEGFENSHDAMDCAGCHEKPAGELKKGEATPPRFAAEGVDAFCRSCHSAVDRTHYPRGNTPPPATTCLNCHKVHGRSLLFPDLRDDFPQFIGESAALNPHGGRIFCLACHPDTPQPGSEPELRFPGNQSQLCRRCHAGVEHHPLAVTSTPATWKMDFAKFPLENEAVTCVTCHDPPECEGGQGRENPRFLRGGPYDAVEEFCARCHEGKKFSSLNPHDQIDESGEVYQKKCLYCHVTVPSVTADPDELGFTDTLTALCVSCHNVGPHPDRDHLVEMPPRMIETLREYEERRLVRLPLDEERVVCTTCHNPHERGLLKGPPGVGADERVRLRLTTFNEQCTPCHGRH